MFAAILFLSLVLFSIGAVLGVAFMITGLSDLLVNEDRKSGAAQIGMAVFIFLLCALLVGIVIPAAQNV